MINHLSRADPLYLWLLEDIYPRIGLKIREATINVYSIKASHDIYIYECWHEGRNYRVVGKFHGNQSHAEERFYHEIENYKNFERMKLLEGSHRAPRLLGYHKFINYIIIMEYFSGRRLDNVIKDAIYKGKRRELYQALTEIAFFLFLLHSKSTKNSNVDFEREKSYFYQTLERLKKTTYLSKKEEKYFHFLINKWMKKSEMCNTSTVFVHGDSTPSNFILASNPKLVVLDLERCRRSDPAFDTGRISGELKHMFMLLTGDGLQAEPFIKHFYQKYSGFFNSSNLFKQITSRNPFYQSVTELRIAKNPWIPNKHRYSLIQEAKKCLE